MPPHPEYVRLLHGPYQAPALRRGDRATCLFRDVEVVITSWTDARIPWPRCRCVEYVRSGPGLLVDEELARAIRCESALALRYWWGVGETLVGRWRRALGVPRLNEGSALLRARLNREIGDGLRGVPLPRERVERGSRTQRERGRGRRRPPPGGRPWTADELALLGTLPDEELALRIGRTVGAVRQRRTLLGIPTARDRRRR